MGEFTFEERKYRSRGFDADVHISVMLKLLPLFAAVAKTLPLWKPVLDDVRAGALQSRVNFIEVLGKLGDSLGPVATAFSDLESKDHARGIISACLEATDQQKPDGQWVRVVLPSGIVGNDVNKTYMAKLAITFNVIRFNFSDQLRRMGFDIDAIDEPEA